MKSLTIILASALAVTLAGRASARQVVTVPVGPNPLREMNPAAADGQLQVFSAPVAHMEGDNPTWYRHADYSIYDQSGRLLKHVDNAVGHYEGAPRLIDLPPGKYVVKAPARDYLSVKVPVVIQRGRLTRVHLDDAWRPPADISNINVVFEPGGQAIGWRAGLANAPG